MVIGRSLLGSLNHHQTVCMVHPHHRQEALKCENKIKNIKRIGFENLTFPRRRALEFTRS